MKKYSIIFNIFISTISLAMDETMVSAIRYEQAINQHILGVVDLLNKAENDKDKIVIVPKDFRYTAVNNAIQNKQLYIACNNTKIIAFKKLFIINNKSDYKDITKNEIRCHGKNTYPIDTHKIRIYNNIFNASPNTEYDTIPSFKYNNSLVIYFGGDYTDPEYRNKGINGRLTYESFEQIKNTVINLIQQKNLWYIVLLYGLTKFNSGEDTNGIDRTPSISKAFITFAQTIQKFFFPSDASNPILHHLRYQAFMPTFDPESKQCVPLSDGKSIPGYGNILVFTL